ncbi:FAD-binding protein [Mycobacterium sp. 21AC1]|uniref:FAD-binding protein n=1 Tax=[Mycobacterium] appelbergii TaxID=2939269 RepID=UPI00293934F0|nr:FAD-binding protein [Mycobacterium sp. 21AC1]MDV3129509.1 FAD-binding protein [Mycobacterium sp. 21AC1]
MPPRERQLATSVLVVGAGASGLRAAIEVAEAGIAVTAVSKRPVSTEEPGTVMSTGGISAALATTDPADTWEQHAADTLSESQLLADPRTVQLVTRNAAQGIHDLERYGMSFDRQDDGRIAQRQFDAHARPRTAHAGENTAAHVHRVLREHAERLAIPVLTNLYITTILVNNGTVFGAYGFDLVDGTRYLVHADAVILATGGHTRIWRRTSARRDENTGDSFRLAAEAGARLRDPELVQFHPAGLLTPEPVAGILVSESAREEGAILLNNLGERFMTRYDPQRMEKSSRDTVALASYNEIKHGRGTQTGGVWLDLSHLPAETVLTRLPRVYQALLGLQKLDVTRDPIEVAPTAHRSLGGVWTRPEDHGTDIEGLYVTGEAASGLHGANPLGGNFLTALLVCGRITGQAAAEYSARLISQRRSPAAIRLAEADVDRLLAADGSHNVRALQRAVRNLMTEHAGVVRDEAGLRAGLAALEVIGAQMADVGVHTDIGGYRDLAHAFDLRSAVLAARATLECALERRETRGAHIRSDHPDLDPQLQVNLVWSPRTGVRREPIPPIPTDIAELMGDVPVEGTYRA